MDNSKKEKNSEKKCLKTKYKCKYLLNEYMFKQFHYNIHTNVTHMHKIYIQVQHVYNESIEIGEKKIIIRIKVNL